MRSAIALLLLLVASACSTPGSKQDEAADGDEQVRVPDEGIVAMDAALAEAYLRKLAPMLVGRVLTAGERTQIAGDGGSAIEPILEAWTGEPGFAEAARRLIEGKLSVSGQANGIDYDLPGNLAAKVARDDLPWSTVLTSDTCYDAAGEPMTCDTGAPYTAGVLTTRAYMASRAGRFNLTRAGTMLGAFACRRYPVDEAIEPRIDKTRLIEMFRAADEGEQTVEAVKGGFGNGLECYTCHGQFSLHAQLFVRFDKSGVWQEDATGLQNTEEGAQLGESTSGLMASHLADPAEASEETSQYWGEPVENLAGAAAVLGASAEFGECAVQNILEYGIDLDGSVPVSQSLVAAIADRARQGQEGDPTFAALVIAVFTDPDVAFNAAHAFRGLVGDAPAEETP